jgi:hypothetical protein
LDKAANVDPRKAIGCAICGMLFEASEQMCFVDPPVKEAAVGETLQVFFDEMMMDLPKINGVR